MKQTAFTYSKLDEWVSKPSLPVTRFLCRLTRRDNFAVAKPLIYAWAIAFAIYAGVDPFAPIMLALGLLGFLLISRIIIRDVEDSIKKMDDGLGSIQLPATPSTGMLQLARIILGALFFITNSASLVLMLIVGHFHYASILGVIFPLLGYLGFYALTTVTPPGRAFRVPVLSSIFSPATS